MQVNFEIPDSCIVSSYFFKVPNKYTKKASNLKNFQRVVDGQEFGKTTCSVIWYPVISKKRTIKNVYCILYIKYSAL